MKAQELRIGNYYNFFNGFKNILCEVSDLSQFEIDGVIETDERIQPIPLTEEWLLKFGFESKGDDWEIEMDEEKYNYLKIDKDSHILSIEQGDSKYDNNHYIIIDRVILYVHQLQNLYHALTGEELTIKE